MDLPTRLLRQFDAIADCGGVVPAARRLRMSQSALSSALQRLENEVGAPLVVRGRDFALTDAGAVVLEHTRRILEDLQEAEDAIARVGTEKAAEVSVALAPEAAVWPAPDLADRLVRFAPTARIVLTACESAVDASALLGTGRADLAVLPAAAVPLRSRSVRVGEHRPRVIVPDSWQVENGRLPLSRLRRFPLIAAVGDDTDRAVAALRRLTAHPRIVMDGVPLAAVIPLVGGGVGAGVIPQELTSTAERAGCTVLDGVELPSAVLVAAWAMERLTPVLRHVLDAAQQIPI